MATPTFPTTFDPSSLPKSTIKALTDSGPLFSVPAEYIHSTQPPHLDDVAEEEEEAIPILDFSLLTHGSPKERSQAIHDLVSALEDWGFLMVLNHGVPERVTAAVLEKCREFFDLTEDEKRAFAGKSVLDTIRYGTSFNPEMEDVRYWRDYLRLVVNPTAFNCPANPPGLRDCLSEYSTCIAEIVKQLLKGISECVEIEECFMEKETELDHGVRTFAVNLYPPCPQPELALGFPPHSDHGFLTVLLQNGVNGLQVKHHGKWVDVKAAPNCLLINAGDHMEILTNGKFKGVVHRAVLNNKATRLSVAVVHAPQSDSVVAPLPEFVKSTGGAAAFRGITYKEYMQILLRKWLKEKLALDSLRL